MKLIKQLGGMDERIEMLVQQITFSTGYHLQFRSDTEAYGIRVAAAMLVAHAGRQEGSVAAVIRSKATRQLYDIIREMEKRNA